jgi:hypothetical protein
MCRGLVGADVEACTRKSAQAQHWGWAILMATLTATEEGDRGRS